MAGHTGKLLGSAGCVPEREGLGELSALAVWPERLPVASVTTRARLDCPGAQRSRAGKDSRPAVSTQGCLRGNQVGVSLTLPVSRLQTRVEQDQVPSLHSAHIGALTC